MSTPPAQPRIFAQPTAAKRAEKSVFWLLRLGTYFVLLCAAFIFIDSRTGENAIIIEAGAAAALTEAEMEAAAPAIAAARIFVAQLELPLPVVRRSSTSTRPRASSAGSSTIPA